MAHSISCMLVAAALGASSLPAAISITSLTPSQASPQPVGASITWTASATDTDAGTPEYQFSAEPAGAPAQIRKDFNPNNVWSWTPSAFEGNFTVGVVVKNASTGNTASATVSYTLKSRLLTGHAAVNPTNHPLVALFSAPACQKPNFMRVRFQRPADTTSQTTNLVSCRFDTTSSSPDATSMNFYIAGMYASSTYMMRWETVNPGGTTLRTGPQLSFTTGALPSNVFIPTFTLITPPPSTDTQQPILLQAFLSIPQGGGTPLPTATDLNGVVLWYLPVPISEFGRTEVGGNVLATMFNNDPTQNYVREYDLAGNVVLETNVARMNEQLIALGRNPITGFHHEARRIYGASAAPPNGYIMTLGTDQMSSTSAQGGTPANPVDILGDEILVMDQNLQLVWSWDAFQHLDITRAAILGETCSHGTAGCQPFNTSFTIANDWLHSNSIQYTPWDGNLVLSMRHQDWVVKVNFSNGTGNGGILWRMGPDGDFMVTQNNTKGPADLPGFPWFSHQHDANFQLRGKQFNGNFVFMAYDDGNTRQAKFDSNAHSRCQLYAVNETGRAANLNINADLGVFSLALGSAQLLTHGDLHCDSGFVGGFGGYTLATENDQNANIVYSLKASLPVYRSFRMVNLYTPALP